MDSTGSPSDPVPLRSQALRRLTPGESPAGEACNLGCKQLVDSEAITVPATDLETLKKTCLHVVLGGPRMS